MATDIEDNDYFASKALPAPADTPYRTPVISRRSSRYETSSPVPSSSPPPLPPDLSGAGEPGSKDVSTDENISLMDPRRFTPTLHASLVSEILSLRRDLDAKNGLVENLETSLHSSREDNELLNQELVNNTKEIRQLKRQVQLIEGGQSSTFGDLIKERDEAVDNISEVRKRLEASQKKVRAQEEEVERLHDLWGRDKETWDGERRNLERKVHVVEGRLKTILEEVAAQQAISLGNPGGDSDVEEATKDSGIGHGSDTASIRSLSMKKERPMSSASIATHDGQQFDYKRSSSVLSGAIMQAGKLGLSLADELETFDDDENAQPESEAELDETPKVPVRESHPHRHRSKASLDLTNGQIPPRIPENEELVDQTVSIRSSRPSLIWKKPIYVDTGIQPSPPVSPTENQPEPEQISEEHEEALLSDSAQPSADVEVLSLSTAEPSIVEVVTVSTQTTDDLIAELITPLSPKSPTRAPPPPPVVPVVEVETKSISTQTDVVEEIPLSPTRAPPPPPIQMQIPTIEIHPSSAPGSPKETMLPPGTKNAACQTSTSISGVTRSVSVQTEAIKLDKRIMNLPAHLLPSSLSQPKSPQQGKGFKNDFTPVPGNVSRLSRQLTNGSPADSLSSPPLTMTSKKTQDSNGAPSARRRQRPSRMFGGLDFQSSDDADEYGEADLSEGDYRTPLTAPNPKMKSQKKLNGVQHDTSRKSDDSDRKVTEQLRRPKKINGPFNDGEVQLNGTSFRGMSSKAKGKQPQLDKPFVPTSTKAPNIRKTALISSGAAAHSQQRARSPSLPSISGVAANTKEPVPPFPVPTRYSSRRMFFDGSDGRQTPTPDEPSHLDRDQYGYGEARVIEKTVRKSRSVQSLAKELQQRQRSRSPPPMSLSSGGLGSPQLPPIPTDDIQPDYGRSRGHKHQESAKSSNTTATGTTGFTGNGSTANGSVTGGNQQTTTVVDAIAQTMVGEWMYKYVRKRKSLEPAKGGDDSAMGASGTRHRRWVWLAPYEKSVLWSSKQPTSGSALLGKSGRKLTIQSVLDVKDDTPFPRNTGPQPPFNRSILILTPARALKFTASSRERHYVWLSALSFLAHSSQGASNTALAALPPIPQLPQLTHQISQQLSPQPAPPQEPAPPPQPTTYQNGVAALRRQPIRDSIRIAKGKARPRPNGHLDSINSSVPSHGAPESRPSMASSQDRSFHLPSLGSAAEPPDVPRFHHETHNGHGRKRSNTGGLPHRRLGPSLPSALRTASISTAATSVPDNPSAPPSLSAINGDRNQNGHIAWSGPPSFTTSARGTSDAGGSYAPSYSTAATNVHSDHRPNFFEAIPPPTNERGMVRMEAFVERPRPYGGGGGGYSRERETSRWGRRDRDDLFGPTPLTPEYVSVGGDSDPFRGF